MAKWPKNCATCGYAIKSAGDELRHIHQHMGYPVDEARYALLDEKEQREKAEQG